MRKFLPCAGIVVLGSLALSGAAGAAIQHRAVVRSPAIGAKKSPPETEPVTGFGGYTWLGKVESIAAEWQVPTVASSSVAGIAYTWIGAQTVNGLTPPFIQLGTAETARGRGSAASYEVFWSDQAVGNHPKYIGRVAGGDALAASMQRTASGWQLLVRDKTSGTIFAKTVAYDPRGSYTMGEWLQEDPVVPITSSLAARDGSYPRTSTVGFEDVKVNGAVPDLHFANGRALSATGDDFFVPSPFAGDSFQLLPATGFARRYLLDAAAFNSVEDAYEVEFLSSWASDEVKTRVADVQRLITACDNFTVALERGPWPAASRPAMLRLALANAADASLLGRWARVGASPHGTIFNAEQKSGNDLTKVADAARATLGLPPV